MIILFELGLFIQLMAGLLIFYAVFEEYYITFIKKSPKTKSSFKTLFATSFLSVLLLGISIFLICLFIINIIMLLKIYFKKKTPTHIFLCFSMINALISAIIPFRLLLQFFLAIMIATGIVALIEDKLLKSEKKYHEAYNRAEFYKDLFAHDINNILQIIQSSMDLSSIYLNEPVDIDKINEVIDIAKEQIIRGANLSSNVKRLSQLENCSFSLKKTNPLEILEDVINSISNNYQNRDINIIRNFVENKLLIEADDLLIDVFENIIINSINHNKNQNIKIIIKSSKIQIKDSFFLKIEFIDNGMGIPDSVKKSIFKKIYQRDENHKRIGLGLSLINEIVRCYNGKIWVENRVLEDYTKGSNFILIFPLISK